MSYRTSFRFKPIFSVAFFFLVVVFVGGSGCGRSGLDDYYGDGGLLEAGPEATVDGPVDGPLDVNACNSTTCPQGCCNGAGQCEPGGDLAACGAQGVACRNCPAQGFQLCDPTRHACGNQVVSCGPSNCPSGCCEGNICFAGNDPNACGTGGQTCAPCASSGLSCVGSQCVQPKCGPLNCSGCCFGEQCLGGTDATACGRGGQQCGNCAAQGQSCTTTPGAPGGACFGQTSCRQSCVGGCCDGNGTCQSGTLPYACGGGGSFCQNCAQFGEPCVNQQCIPTPPPTCGPWNCQGCCDSAGNCQSGVFDNQCGIYGNSCFNCEAQGNKCLNQQCSFQTQCNPATCPFGCCDSNGFCQPGYSDYQCGNFGGYCQDCLQFGESCLGQQCLFSQFDGGACNSQTCPFGCCDSNGFCQSGSSDYQCGNFGNYCQDCPQFGEQCLGQQCAVPPPDGGPFCNSQTCPFGCCDSKGVCETGVSANSCGNYGGFCQNCTKNGLQCIGQQCVSNCSQNCFSGCCDSAGNCQAGFLDTQCGDYGSVCQDCTSLSPPSTCDVSLNPRTCVSQQMQCPAPYAGCSPSLQETALTKQPVCPSADLKNAAAACAQGASTAACGSFFQYEYSNNNACATCLQAFDYDFSQQAGLFQCAASFVDATCNHETACLLDCTNQSCGACPDQTTNAQCTSQVTTGSAQCSTFSQGTQCVTTALSGSASVCNPSTYGGNFGSWLQGVGAQYCGQ